MTPSLNKASGSLSSFGVAAGIVYSDIAKGFADAAVSVGMMAVNFQASMTNIQAVTSMTNTEIDVLGSQLQSIGAGSIFGGQEVAAAFYDIAGAVTDVNLRIPILNQSISLATAGATDLGSAVSALTGIMNSYGYAADQASFASDVLTRTVGMGVGTMLEFSTALPQVTGLAAAQGVALEDLAAAMAFITTKGISATMAQTQLKAIITALIKPNEQLKEAYREMGIASGQAAIEQYGMVGALELVSGTAVAADEGMAALLGSTEALSGATALLSDDFAGFSNTFIEGIEGATAAAEKVQLESVAAQWELLKSKFEAVGLAIAEKFLPFALQAINVVESLINVAGTLGEVLGIDLGIEFNTEDVISTATATGAAIVTEAETGLLAGWGNPDTTLTNTVTVTFEAGDTAYGIWAEEFADIIDFDSFKAQIESQFPAGMTWTTIPTGWSFKFDLEGGVTLTADEIEGTTNAFAAFANSMSIAAMTGDVFANTTPRISSSLAALDDAAVPIQGTMSIVALGLREGGNAAQESAPKIQVMTSRWQELNSAIEELIGVDLNLEEAFDVTAWDNLSSEWDEFIAGFSDAINWDEAMDVAAWDNLSTEWSEFTTGFMEGEWITTAVDMVTLGFMKLELTIKNSLNKIGEEINEFTSNPLFEELGIAFEIMPTFDTTTLETEIANFQAGMALGAEGAVEIDVQLTLADTGSLEEAIAAIGGEDGLVIQTTLSDELVLQSLTRIQEAAGVPLNFNINGQVFTSLDEVQNALGKIPNDKPVNIQVTSNVDEVKAIYESIVDRAVTLSITTNTGGSGVILPALAIGGPVMAGTPYIVGEAGPELFVPSGNGRIVPNHQLGSGSGMNISGGTFNIYGVQDVQSLYDQLMEVGMRRA